MRHVVAVLKTWQWLLCTCLILLRHILFVRAERDFALALEDKLILDRELTTEIGTQFVACSTETQTCPVARYGHDLATIFKNLRDKFDSCAGTKCNYLQNNCNEFWASSFDPLDNMRQTCTGDWPPSCQSLYLLMNTYRGSESYGLSVLCSLIQPGDNLVRKPHCRALAKSTTAKETSLGECSGMAFNECVSYFCGLYSDFFWRMRPSNMQKPESAAPLSLWSSDYVLQGCESVISTPFPEKECPNRRDIHGICQCLCKDFPNMPTTPAVYECPANIDTYLLFGRFQVEGVELDSYCEDALCSLLSASRARCPTMELPDEGQCKALQLAAMSTNANMENCPWLTDSGEDGVLECLDGYRCNVDRDSWACCYSHLGRARCPRDRPQMCNYLCSGHHTEYCCEEAWKCEQRACSPLLVNLPWTVVPTTRPSTTLLTFSNNKDEGGGISFRLPPGSWVWLLLIIPFFLGIICVCLWRRHYKASQFVLPTKPVAVEDADQEGRYHKVKKKERDEELPDKNKLQVKLVVEELPAVKPLGLELFETKVNRVHSAGAVWGWQVGDNIVQVGGFPVSTFEDIWARIQIERDRLPCTFVVERQVMAPTYLDNIRGQQQRRIEDGSARDEASGRIADSKTTSAPGSRIASKLADSDSTSRPPGSRIASKLADSEFVDSRPASKLEVESRRNTSKLPGAIEDDRSSRYVGRTKSRLSSSITSTGTGTSQHESNPYLSEQEKLRFLRFQHILEDCGSVTCNQAADSEIDMEAIANQLTLALKARDRKHLRQAIAESVSAGLPAVEVKLAQDVLLELEQAHRMERRRNRAQAKKEEDSESEDDEEDDPRFSIDWWLDRADVPIDEGALDNWEQWQLQLEDAEPEPPIVPDWQIERAKGFTVAGTFQKTKPYHAWLHDAQELVKSQAPEGSWRRVAGLVEADIDTRYQNLKMTVDQAKQVCLKIRGCRGFSHAGPPTNKPVEMVFKSESVVHRTEESTWTTYLMPEVNLNSGGNQEHKKPTHCQVCDGKCSNPVEPETKKEDIGNVYCEVCKKQITDKSIVFGGFRGPNGEAYHPNCLKEEVRQLQSTIGAPKEWICSVCKRGNKIDEDVIDPKCSVCGTRRNYINARLDNLAAPSMEIQEYGTNKAVEPRVRFKKDAVGRFVYEVVK